MTEGYGTPATSPGSTLPAATPSPHEKGPASEEGLDAAQRDMEALKVTLKGKSPEQLIQSFIPNRSQKHYGGYEYYYNYMANRAIRAELESRGASARDALLAHRDDHTRIWEAINGPGDTVGDICAELLKAQEQSFERNWRIAPASG